MEAKVIIAAVMKRDHKTSERVCSKKYDLNVLPACEDNGDSFACDDEEII